MAAKKVDTSNLGYLGTDFQYKLVKYFVEDPKFFEGIANIVEQNAFTEPLLRTFVGVVKDYYSTKNIVPSYEIANTILRSKAKNEIEITEYDELVSKLKFNTGFDGYDLIKEMALKFFRQQKILRAANKMIEKVGKGDIDQFDDCMDMMQEALMSGEEEDFGFSIFDNLDKALSDDYTVSIPTGIEDLDKVLGGGLDKGKLGLLIAPAGFGKTSFTTAIDSYAASYKCDINNHQGFKVLQIYFEDDDVDITRKHFSKLTETEARFLKRLNKPERDEIESMLLNHKDKELLSKNLRLKHFKTGTKSATDIEIFVKKLINSGFKPDMISIDYFECLAPEKGGYSTDTEWTREGATMRKLENMAHDLDIAIWIPTQGTKDSMNSPEVVRMDQASGSAKKVHVAQLILSIARAIGDIDKSRAVISILKNRSGKSGKIFDNVYFDNGTCTISCSDMKVFDDDLTWKEEYSRQTEEHRTQLTREISQKLRKENALKSDTQGDSPSGGGGNFVGHLG